MRLFKFTLRLFVHGRRKKKLQSFTVCYYRTLANGSGAVKNSSKLPRSTDRKNSLSSPAMPLTTSQGERFRVTCHDGSSRVGLMTPAARAWQQQEPGRAKSSSQVNY